MRVNNAILTLIGLLLVGCAMPTTVVKTTDTRPRISITGAPEGSLLYVDGINMGSAAQFDGHPDVLIIQSGTHKVQVYSNNKAIFEKNIFVESELKNIMVR